MDDEERVPSVGLIHDSPTKSPASFQKAYLAIQKKDTMTAINVFIQWLKKNHRNAHEMRLCDQITLTKLIKKLKMVVSTPNEYVLQVYLETLNAFPENALLLNEFGLLFFAQGEYVVSRDYFRKAGNFGYLPGEKNYLHVIWHLIPRWHFRMLNDKHRNECYKLAITKAVKAGFNKVYDIGSGCGLLSLIAKSAGKKTQVVAFEESKILLETMTEIFKRNNITEPYRLLHVNTNDLNKPPAPCNLIITEIFDAGVFGEQCLKTIKHALNTFISRKKYKIIPASAELFVTGIESKEIIKKYRYVETFEELKLTNICLVTSDTEPYDAEYLKNKDVTYMTETKSFLNVNFYDREQLDMLLSDDNSIEQVELTCTQSGVIRSFAVWFDLHLDEEVTISTHPSSPDNKCWEQAVIHLKHPLQVEKGEIIKLQPRMVDGQINLELSSPEIKCESCIQARGEIISFLNDVNLVESIAEAANTYGDIDVKMVDFNTFPLFGFLMAKRGATVYHIYKEESDLVLFNHILTWNEISPVNFVALHEDYVNERSIFFETPNLVCNDLIRADGSWNKSEYEAKLESSEFCFGSVPFKVFLMAQLISSEYLDFCNKVDDQNTLNFKISDIMNQFSGNEHPNLDFFKYETHSKIVEFDISYIDFYDFDLKEEEAEVTEEGKCNAILYWFEIQWTDFVDSFYSTLGSTYYDRCCTLLKKPKLVEKDQKVKIFAVRHEGHLKVDCL